MNPRFEQLPLAVQLRDDATFDNFYAEAHPLVVQQLLQQLSGGERYLYVFGPAASGRSHLLQAACHLASAQGKAAVYLPLRELYSYPAKDLLDGLAELDLVCLDDLDTIVAQAEWEEAIFHLFNQLAERQAGLLIAANNAVAELGIALPDLASRLGWGVSLRLPQLTDADRINILQFRARLRGMPLTDEVAQFVYHRCQRDLHTLVEVLGRLDNMSLQEKRRLTVPFVKSALGW